jgi:hypothetical protein
MGYTHVAREHLNGLAELGTGAGTDGEKLKEFGS